MGDDLASHSLLHRRHDPAIAYSALLQHGSPEEMLDNIDGNLLVDTFRMD